MLKPAQPKSKMLTTVIFLIVSFGGLVYSRAASLSISASLKHASKEAYYERNLRTVQAIYNLTVRVDSELLPFKGST